MHVRQPLEGEELPALIGESSCNGCRESLLNGLPNGLGRALAQGDRHTWRCSRGAIGLRMARLRERQADRAPEPEQNAPSDSQFSQSPQQQQSAQTTTALLEPVLAALLFGVDLAEATAQ